MRAGSTFHASSRAGVSRLIPLLLFGLLLGCNKKPNDQLVSKQGSQPNDQSISQQVEERLFQDPTLRNGDIQVESQNGVVTLRGTVDEKEQKASAERIAGQVPGVRRVVVALEVAEAMPKEETTPLRPAEHVSEPAARPSPPGAPPRHKVKPVIDSAASLRPKPPLPDSTTPGPVTPASLTIKIWSDPIDLYLSRKPNPKTPSPLTGTGPVFESNGKQYTMDARLIVAISAAETSFATGKCHSTPVSTTRNAWNWFHCYASKSCGTDQCANSPFDSWERGISIVSKFVQRNYIMKGLSDVRKVQTKYCTEGCEHWVPNVEAVMKELGGDPEQLTLVIPK